jgi:hypothetical protein
MKITKKRGTDRSIVRGLGNGKLLALMMKKKGMLMTDQIVGSIGGAATQVSMIMRSSCSMFIRISDGC